MGRGYGVPQGPQGSDLFANLYLSVVDRQLLRAGIPFDRHVDDYLLRSSSLPDARRHLLTLEASLRGIGLILNHQKTQVLSREAYEAGLAAFQEILAEAAIETIEAPAGYTFDPDAFADIDLSNAKQETIEAAFLTALNGDEEKAFEARRRMIDKALPYLAAFGSTVPVDHLDDVIGTFGPQIRNVNLYLRRLIGTDSEQSMVGVVDGVLRGDLPPVPWVQGWLIDVLARAVEHPLGATPWLLAVVDDATNPWFLRTRALIAASRMNAIPSQDAVNALFAACPPANQPDIIAAIALSGRDWAEDFLRSLGAKRPVLSRIPGLIEIGDLVQVL